MALKIRLYRSSDRPLLEALLAELQDHLVRVDRWGYSVREPSYASKYRVALLRRVRQRHGFVLMAEFGQTPVGFVAAWYSPVTELYRLETRPSRQGWVSDLAILKPWRRRGIGTRLLKAAIARLTRARCDIVALGAFYPNQGARRLYRRLGFSPRQVMLAKRTGKPPHGWGPVIRDPRFRDRK